MTYYLGSLGADLTAVIIVTVPIIYFYLQHKLTYWTRKGVPSLSVTEHLWHAVESFSMRKCFGEMIQVIYDETKRNGNKYAGFYLFGRPKFLPADPDLMKEILTAQFRCFHDRSVFIDEELDPLTGNLFGLKGQKWRNLRIKLTPTFTTGKMKMMFKSILAICEQLEQTVGESIEKNELIDIKDILARFAADVIGSVAFGIDCNSLQDPNSEFRQKGLMVFEDTFTEKLRNLCFLAFPGLLKFFKLPIVNPKIGKFFVGVIQETVDYREKNRIVRNDFLDLLIKLKNNESLDDDDESKDSEKKDRKNVDPCLTLNEIAAQCFIFYVAGFDTTSSTMTFCLYELCVNNTMQEKLREEIRGVLKKHDGQFTYEVISQMQYLDKVVKETLRKYPVAPFLNRECVEDFKIPGSDCVIEKGTSVMISLLGIHRDPEYYPNPMIFDPERFNDTQKCNTHPYTYLPFGEGPRSCIGMRFGVMQVKLGLAVLIKSYKFTLNQRTTEPLTMDPKSPVLLSKGGIWLNAEKVHP